MSWRLGSQVRVATPEGDVYVANNCIHHHNSVNHRALFVVAHNKKSIIPFVVTEEFLDADDLSDKLEDVSFQLLAVMMR